MRPKFRLFATKFDGLAVVHRYFEHEVLDGQSYSAGRFGRLLCNCLRDRRANGAGNTMPCGAANSSSGALVVVAPYRWTKMLVRRQNDGFKIVAGMGGEVSRTPAGPCRSHRLAHRAAQRPRVRFASVNT